jgi:hypothetical protein
MTRVPKQMLESEKYTGININTSSSKPQEAIGGLVDFAVNMLILK